MNGTINYVLVNVNDDFDPTPKLKFSPIPIWFVSFNKIYHKNCIYCGDTYTALRRFS